ncbi:MULTISPECIES: DNA/RNA nuclease SfsA [unclassified Rhizobium]|uniref:DNA/RNA nuclease SfsA n=1 Tax=unclassified Rhizobium TaxID=2613769 RepID=UPI001ADA66A3|nr:MULTISPECIES: DNA/RNA nuclease SfsA [unclassified Rhizobium]MBO9098682.1 DNA/RNA nuclease SfsA [Rhizobium sp. L58/93]MBO9132513.1 DNA/RNA nuclease SfsA [Rhizobium sp. B209b/85]MBO9168948.1 DNA/RNA nuclease SfsA [Rhizobium sp. L245/93]MBO9184898.1 DNA/RNA nuclease SfsA [Rhizobium sp. E27B/91]QXZ85063.1 DNA/RNA nuclease SfsA [Rhizobium sp. K1/93]
MLFERPLVPARLIARYKRFLFDAELESGGIVTGFCPNTGSMRGLTTPGSRIWLSEHDSQTRKYRYVFELIEADGTRVGVNTALPNRLAEEAIRAGLVADLGTYPDLRREQKYGRNSRIDMLLAGPGKPPAYVEVKNVHFARTPGLAEFPDSVTSRGAKHLEELGDMVELGHRAVMLYVIQRDDCSRFRICDDLDPQYGRAYLRARQRGVEAFALKCSISPLEITAAGLIPMDEPGIAALQTQTAILD